MSYVTHALPTTTSFDLPLTGLKQSARVIAEAVMWLGGGVLFAATVYVMVALPGLIE